MPKVIFSKKVFLRAIKSTLTILLSVYVGFGVLLYFNQTSFLYFPTDEVIDDSQPKMVFQSGGENIVAWVTHPGKDDAMIFFGGNGMRAYDAIPQVERALRDMTGYLVEYRGYGSSTGNPSEVGIKQDALSIFDAVKKKHRNVSMVGRSLGSGVAAYVASRRNIYRLVLITPYDSIEAIAKERYPIYPVETLLEDKYETASLVKDIRAPTLMVLAENDQIVPHENAHRLAESFPQDQLRIETIPHTSHNTISAQPRYEELIKNFLTR